MSSGYLQCRLWVVCSACTAVVLFCLRVLFPPMVSRTGLAGLGLAMTPKKILQRKFMPPLGSTFPPHRRCTIILCPNYRTYNTSQFKVLVVLLSISAPFLLLSAHGARASGPLIVTHGPERRRPPPGQARSGRQRPHALLGRRGQRRPALLGASVWWQYNVAGRQSPRRRGPLTDEFASTTTPVFFCTTTAPAAEAHSSASADADWVSNHQRGVRKRNVDFL